MRRLIHIARTDPAAYLGIIILALFVIAPLFWGE